MAPVATLLPGTKKEWLRDAGRHDATSRQINRQVDVNSASHFRDIDFYSLRVLVPKIRGIKDFKALDEYVSKRQRDAAALAISHDAEWEAYLGRLHYTTTDLRDKRLAGVGRFTDALVLNLAVNNDSRAPTPDPSGVRTLRPRSQSFIDALSANAVESDSPDDNQDPAWTPTGPSRTKARTRHRIDEHTPHVSCWSLLNNMTLNDAEMRISWTPTEVAFCPPFVSDSSRAASTSQQPATSPTTQTTTPKSVYTAQVDGVALGWDSGQCLAITEVKKIRRYTGKLDSKGDLIPDRGIVKQEAAEMAAWIAECPPNGWHNRAGTETRLLIAQNRDSLYVVFGVFDYDYVKWIRGVSPGNGKKRSFLTMQSFGPYHTRAKGDMALFQMVVQGHLRQLNET